MGLSAKSKQTVFESKTITLNATGTVATGGTLSNPGANPTITITTTKRLKSARFFAYTTEVLLDKLSTGTSDGTIQNCTDEYDVSLSSNTKCIVIAGTPTAGMRASISAINDTSFDITFTLEGNPSGYDIEVQMQLQEQ